MKYAYKVTDIDALAAAYPEAVVTVRSVNRAELGKLIRAAKVLKHNIAGVEVLDVAESPLAEVPNQQATDEKPTKSLIQEKFGA